jgi:hypothetical protein
VALPRQVAREDVSGSSLRQPSHTVRVAISDVQSFALAQAHSHVPVELGTRGKTSWNITRDETM